jgi:hypothetical protein
METKSAQKLGRVCAAISGFAAWFFALILLGNDNAAAMGLCLTAAAIAFGLLSRTN